MLNFDIHFPTRIHFGRGKIEELAREILVYGRRVLLVYGGGSIKRSGLYEQVVNIFDDFGITHLELSGVQPNPRISSVRQGVELCKEHEIELVLAVGGGSTIDCAKIIAAGAGYEGDAWDFFTRRARINYALPLGCILTLAATGSEMNGNAVISNKETEQKLGTGSTVLIPRFSILDPEYSFSVPPEQTAAGTVDIMSHVFEQYFSPTPGTFIQDRLAEAMLKTCIHYGPIALAEPDNYEARANLMWTGSLALNGLLGAGKRTDWATHDIEHEISALYDITHGLGLAILTPYWMHYVMDEVTAPRLADYARQVWSIEGTEDLIVARAGIKKTAEFFRSLHLAGSLSEIGVESDRLIEMAEKATAHGTLGSFKKLEFSDVLKILTNAFNGK
ncbi:MAG: iron-containing alcohol dehydrogenase [Syntrophomonas sp.]|uniref:iron-containing alcohol dehydrogenase n=1 Tax=Syntrophomonas sp. TaxID=2053627 RepID=UPI002605964D|nr:iron-containing alcohol dehydrogenase [Syntrophomonas sp.]MDD2510185.1 iron-containing alcohol dehydrogenase [Syntrophomonas sp.]MDD3879163.1 iron-containing alcohol dehydrogenase [Syntrophomonas sp.]MDD4625792.1 iron-containing alcohol dehydrogenase [Syntrophomonas sp.]